MGTLSASYNRPDQSRVVIDGLTAANDLGLTTAAPARITVLTDARLRSIQLGNSSSRFARSSLQSPR
jgi:hypothetical protein